MNKELTPALFVCATPIGNLSDVTTRLIETLNQVDIIAAEDTRITLNLLGHLNIKTKLTSLQKFNEKEKSESIITYLKQGQSVALVSDAGTPVISDPGVLLIDAVIKAGFDVIPIPGPSAISTFLSASGLNADSYVFAGFFPRKESEYLAEKNKYHHLTSPIVWFESPKRIMKTLELLKKDHSISKLVAARELTKKYEHIYRGTIEEIIEKINLDTTKGEWIFGLVYEKKEKAVIDEQVKTLKDEGFSLKQTVFILSKFLNYSKNEVYERYHD